MVHSYLRLHYDVVDVCTGIVLHTVNCNDRVECRWMPTVRVFKEFVRHERNFWRKQYNSNIALKDLRGRLVRGLSDSGRISMSISEINDLP